MGPRHGRAAFMHRPLPRNLYVTQMRLPVSGHYRPWSKREEETWGWFSRSPAFGSSYSKVIVHRPGTEKYGYSMLRILENCLGRKAWEEAG